MVKLIEKILKQDNSTPFFSFEFFPPKTQEGVENLYLRMDRMTSLQPIFVDITWGAGGSTKDLTFAIAKYTQTYFGVECLMHLTCTNMKTEELKLILSACREAGIQNILVLRGDPIKGASAWEPISGGFNNAIELVKLIKKEHGDYFGIAVAGFPEGHPSKFTSNSITSSFRNSKSHSSDIATDSSDTTPSTETDDDDNELLYLKQKIEAGADFILTNFFYDADVFISYVNKCRKIGITCPILPGMMPIQSYSTFQRMTSFCRIHVPQHIHDDLIPIRENDEAVKAYGVELCTQMCQKLFKAGVPGFHFYTLNLEKSVLQILNELGIEESSASRRSLPWRGSRANLSKGVTEDVRPINWANRPKSYIKRTINWDEFPNGRWGDNRSPAFGDLSETHFYRSVDGTKEDRLAMWGEAPITAEDIYEIFALYIEGEIPIIPWCESNLQKETTFISTQLAQMNRNGYLTINSQPAVNAERSDHSVYGWGGPGGRVYQKAYVEFFVNPNQIPFLISVFKKHNNLSMYAVDNAGTFLSDKDTADTIIKRGVTALTWGVFPDKEILQPTVFDANTFTVWSREAFELWTKAWAAIYDDESESCSLIYDIHDTYYLVAVIDNDYIESNLFTVFSELIELKAVYDKENNLVTSGASCIEDEDD